MLKHCKFRSVLSREIVETTIIAPYIPTAASTYINIQSAIPSDHLMHRDHLLCDHSIPNSNGTQ